MSDAKEILRRLLDVYDVWEPGVMTDTKGRVVERVPGRVWVKQGRVHEIYPLIVEAREAIKDG